MVIKKELKIIFADQHLVVINKPGGLLAVPGRGPDRQDSVVSRFKAQFPDAIDQPAVHRLDMATSGLMVLALTVEVHRQL
ncbi:MAG: RluA family pseudouridine synthase, partial [Candidatus Electrothrix sp. AX5]|nr:RluA family pseudouridine synthase [Candidatus Electrothrix sp. AX5]